MCEQKSLITVRAERDSAPAQSVPSPTSYLLCYPGLPDLSVPVSVVFSEIQILQENFHEHRMIYYVQLIGSKDLAHVYLLLVVVLIGHESQKREWPRPGLAWASI